MHKAAKHVFGLFPVIPARTTPQRAVQLDFGNDRRDGTFRQSLFGGVHA